jgi:Hypoxia induced protein conserved region
MGPFSKSVILLAMIAVAVVLALGLFNMAKGGSMSTSQKLMRWRVGLQFIAICVIMTAIYFASH